MKRHAQQGFTLIEAAVAIAVVLILSGIIVPLVVKNLRDSQIARAKNDVQVIAGAIASQLKDVGSRPSVGTVPAGDGVWTSTGAAVGAAFTPAAATGNFTNLFTLPAGSAAATGYWWASGAPAATAEIAYKGPYMGGQDAVKLDPWGHPYILVGYNANGQTGNRPIFVVSVGPDGVTDANNTATLTGSWTITGNGADDIVTQVN